MVLQKPAKHPIVIALNDRPVLALRNLGDQMLDHLTAVGSPICQIAGKHHGGIGATVALNACQCLLQHVKLAVDIAKSIKRLGHLDLWVGVLERGVTHQT